VVILPQQLVEEKHMSCFISVFLYDILTVNQKKGGDFIYWLASFFRPIDWDVIIIL